MLNVAMIVKVISLFVCFVRVAADDADPLLVTLPDGNIRGHILETSTDKDYYAFQQIPFAAPPIGDLRFKEPVAPKPWTGTLNTTENTKICIQAGAAQDREDEDCLYLNVYTPLTPGSTDLLPVLFWIYGGSFTSGEASIDLYGPEHFMDYDVVVVTTNYRVGPLGFLTTDDGVIPGNNGLKDQSLALKWTNTNIKLFGGDPSKITIAGESAGSASVGYQLISKKSKGLFRAAILESGTSLGSWAYQAYANDYAYQLGSEISPTFTTENSTQELLNLLQTAVVSYIKHITISVMEGKENRPGDMGLVWTPVIEDESYEGAFITGLMHEDIQNGDINQVPILIGFNSEEELLFLVEETVKAEAIYLDDNLLSIVNNKYNISDADRRNAAIKIRQIYTGHTDVGFQDDFSAIVRFLSDEAFTTPIIRHAELQSNYTDVYLYQFSHKGPLGGLNVTVAGAEAVGHSEELHYLWNIYNTDVNNYPMADIITHYRMLTLWTNFIKYLNPTPTEDILLGNVIWPVVTPNNITYLNINTTLEVRIDPKEYQKWKHIIDTYSQPPLITY